MTQPSEHAWERTFQERNGTVTWYCRVCDRTVTRPHAYVDRGPHSPGPCVRAIRVPGDYLTPKRLPVPLYDDTPTTVRPEQVVDAVRRSLARVVPLSFDMTHALCIGALRLPTQYAFRLIWLGDPAFVIMKDVVVSAEEVNETIALFIVLMLLKRYRGFETRLTGRDLNRVFPDGVPQPIVMKVKV